MAIYTLDGQRPPTECLGGAVTIGNFDGVHRGHAALVAETCRRAAEVAGPAVALTFDPHPLQLLRPERFLPVLTTIPQRAHLLRALGIHHVLILHTTPELLQHTAREFFDQLLLGQLQVRALIEGTDFRFGHARSGTVDTLAQWCAESSVLLSVLQPVTLEGDIVSSSRIRLALGEGDVSLAATLLGRPHRLVGRVSTGLQRGRTLGFPTANLDPLDTLAPANGVYAVRAWVDDICWPGAANLGPNPTFGEQARKIEIHLIGFHGDLYGKPLTVDFLARLRDTRPFAGLEELKKQLQLDIEHAQQTFDHFTE